MISRRQGIFLLLWVNLILPAWGAPSAIVSEPVPVKKIVCQYALTSANDFPSRDPQDWQLLASNDGGRTWAVLDTRKGEQFSERHQRRIFKISNQTAFSLYRLQIDCVRNPIDADAIQLAEIEPLGVSADDYGTLPIFADRISAKSENPPMESALQAFDGEVTTKWADLTGQNTKMSGSWIQWQYLDNTGLVITNLKQLTLLRGRAAEGYAVLLNGIVIAAASSEHGFLVMDGTRWIETPASNEAGPLYPGQKVLLTGRSRWTGRRATIEPTVIKGTGPLPSPGPEEMKPGQIIASNEDFQWAEIEGVVQFPVQSGRQGEFELLENEQSISVRVVPCERASQLPPVGSRVRVEGVCVSEFNDQGKRVAGRLWAGGFRSVTVLDRDGHAGGAISNAGEPVEGGKSSVLTEIGQIRRLSSEQLTGRRAVRIRGIVTELFGDYIQQGPDGIELMWPNGPGLQRPKFGSYVEVSGNTARGDAGGPAVTVDSIRELGDGKLPEPVRPSWNQLAGGQMNEDWIEMDGLVQATDGSHLLLYHAGRQITATIRSGLASEVKSLVDADIYLRGVCVNAADDRNIVQGIQLIVPSLDFVTVKKPPADSAAIPAWPIRRLYNLGAPNDFNHRVKIFGTLTYSEGRKYFVQDGADSVMAVARTDVVLAPRARNPRWVFWRTPDDGGVVNADGNFKPGDEVEVTGYVESYGYGPMLTEAAVRRVGVGTAVAPAKAVANELATGRYDSMVVSMEGLVLGREMLGSNFVVEVESGQRVFQASLRTDPQRPPSIAPGSLVQLTGVCQMNPISHAELGRAPAAFSLLLRSPSDIAVLRAPSWWTVQRAFGVAGVLVLVLLGALAWVRSLRRQVDERTLRLKQEIADHERTEGLLAKETELLQAEIQKRIRMQAEVDKIHRELLSTSRLAGMAEVATNVLHNVGNVLNSVNVLASSISTYAQKSKVPSVARLAELLEKHHENLGEFLTGDESGRNVPGHLKRLGEHLLLEQSRMLEKAQALTENVQHIKEVVAMQQNYAKVAGVSERVSVAEIVDDALKLCGDAMARHQIDVVQEVVDVIPVTLDRHKVLQILFNLLENAKHACDLRGDMKGEIRVRIRGVGADRIQIQVVDNGIGISAENLPRIFTQGFSTRKGGHGFGLHSSIFAAQDMGGALRVHSDGPNRGATFTLELPVSADGNISRANPRPITGF